jgi:hypothetical protein
MHELPGTILAATLSKIIDDTGGNVPVGFYKICREHGVYIHTKKYFTCNFLPVLS